MISLQALRERGYEWLPTQEHHPVHPLRNAQQVGDEVDVSGQVPFENGVVIAGKIGRDLSPEKGARAAELCALHCLYAAGAVVDPDGIIGVRRMTVYVNVAPGFTETSTVANGASQFLIDLLGEAGKGTRVAVGVAELPLNAAVEIEMTFIVL